MPTINKDLVAASSTPLILSILARGESYGYEIIRQVRALSEGQMVWSDGMLYPLLHRLEKEGLVASVWKVTEGGRKRKYYRINKEGHAALQQERQQWQVVQSTLSKMWEVPNV